MLLPAPRAWSRPARRPRAVAPGARARPDVGRERARVRLVRAVLVIYVLAVIEGAIRKYLAPQLSQYIFFARDPVLFYVYLLAFRYRLWPRRDAFLSALVVAAFLGAVLALLQAAIGGPSDARLLLGVYGWRSYFLYGPLAFLIGTTFQRADVLKVARVTLWLAVPVAVLVAAQFASPPYAAVNVGVAEEESLQFRGIGLDAEHIRPTGTFTSSAGQQQFVGTACAFWFALLLTPASRRGVGPMTIALAAAAILTCVALGGSRGTTLQCGLSVLFAFALGVAGRSAGLKARAIGIPIAIVVAATVLYPIVFPVGFQTFVERWNTAAVVETGFSGGVFGRALYGFVDFVRLIELVPALGYGLGFGGNASTVLGATVDGVLPGKLAETDYARHMVDLGPSFGLAYIALRVAIIIWLSRLVWRATRRAADPLPLLLYSFAAWVIAVGQITGHGTTNVFAWLTLGLCIAASRHPLSATAGPPSLRRRPGRATPTRRQPISLSGTPPAAQLPTLP